MSLITLQSSCLTTFKVNYIHLLTFNYFNLYVCPRVNVCTWMQASTEAKGLRFPRTGVIGGHEPPNLSVALLISETSFLAPTLQLQKKIFFLKYQEDESRNAQCRAHTVGRMMMHAHSGGS